MSYQVMCYTCIRFVPIDHVCEVGKKLAENPIDMGSPALSSAAVPTRQGPDSFRVRRG